MAKISILLENGSNTISLTQESTNLDTLRESIISCMNIVLVQKVCEYFGVVIENPKTDMVKNTGGFEISPKIKGIKAIRTVTGLGLKEAKALYESLESGCYAKLPVTIHKDKKEEVRQTLSECFYEVKFVEEK